MEDIAKSLLVQAQKGFEKRLAAAVLVQATEDFMRFEEPGEAKTKEARRNRAELAAAQQDAANFFESGTREGGPDWRSKNLQFWLDVLSARPASNPRIAKRKHWHELKRARAQLYEATVIARTTDQLAGFPPAVAVEAYRRVVEARWMEFYARHCEGAPSRVMSGEKRNYWKGLYRATLQPEHVEQEAKDIMFERRYAVAA